MVAARETTLQELLEGSKQYQVPLYQRTYSWTRAQLERLWEDIVKLAGDRIDHPKLTHFVGSLVLAPSPSNGPAGVLEYLVVDGQQRLTTLSILLCAIRDHRARTETEEHRERIDQQYLINRWKPERHRLKLLPTQADRDSYRACLDSTAHAGGSDPVGAAYRYFSAQLLGVDDPDDPADIERIEDAVISGLALVSVTAQQGDNAHRIFESLNNTGLRLTQGDLLRNYLFMRLPTRGDTVYHSLWLPLQETLSTADLELLFWLDLVQRDARVKQSDVYAGQQARLDRLQTEQEIENEVARFAHLGKLLVTILDPSLETDPEVRRRLNRLNAWGTTTVYPLLLHLFERRAQQRATSKQIGSAMLYVESFFVRRLLIGRATANINRILLSVVTEMSTDGPVDEAVRAYLSTGRKYYASDDEVRAAVGAVPYYLNGRPRQRALVLQWLEESYESKEPVDLHGLTIEHVLPQTPTPAWKAVLGEDLELGEDLDQVHDVLVHTLGNLTLTGYNPSLSNSDFAAKREKLATSGVAMNQEIAKLDRWGRPQILARASQLAERAVSLWPEPVRGGTSGGPGVRWDVINAALAELPAGAWTTYGDLAALIGTHPVPVGARLSSHPAPNAHRVLQADGTVSDGFRWLDAGRADEPSDLLREEGVTFDAQGRANPNQRITFAELAQLIGVHGHDDSMPRLTDVGTDSSEPGERFLAQLVEQQSPAVVNGVRRVLGAWLDLGGHLAFGAAGETSCFLMSRNRADSRGGIWPMTIYPSGKCEVVFQHLAVRPPFDDSELREELRQRLNRIPGVDLPASKIELRPGFPLTLLGGAAEQDALIEQLSWFRATADA
ncbi:MAG: GmrSD restriction endonuclease domain-containing protein [Pseudonocardiales bacterium]